MTEENNITTIEDKINTLRNMGECIKEMVDDCLKDLHLEAMSLPSHNPAAFLSSAMVIGHIYDYIEFHLQEDLDIGLKKFGGAIDDFLNAKNSSI